MSVSAALQRAIYGRLAGDATVSGFVGSRIYDGVPADAVFPYVAFGPSDWFPDDAEEIPGRVERVQIDVWGRDNARLRIAKEIADAVASSLRDAELDLDVGGLVVLNLLAVQVMPDRDGVTAHGIVSVDAIIEEPT